MQDEVYELNALDRDTIRLGIWGVDLKRYVPEVIMVCAKLGIDEPPWFADDDIRDRVEANAELRETYRSRYGRERPSND